MLAAVGIAATTAGALAAGTLAAYSATTAPAPRPSTWVPYGTEVIAHGGDLSVAPKNTPAALRAAFANGADAVEFDVLSTKDNRLVVMHDGELAAHTQNCTGLVRDRSYAYVRACRTLDGAQVPNLYDALTVVRDAGRRAYVHVKTSSGKGLAAGYMKAVNKYGLNRDGHVVFYSSSTAVLDELRKEGAAAVGLTFVDSRASSGWASKYPILLPYDTAITTALVRAAQARGQAVVPTESRRITLEDARVQGVDGFMANDLGAARTHLN
ncbi:MAG: glycerophosphodiester phosphodiesterase [Sporichthyaceae bacterium]|jgi:glycerophosphoryl diester phosphodiesterase